MGTPKKKSAQRKSPTADAGPATKSLVTERYLELVRYLAEAWGGSVAAAASHLGVHRSYLGTLLRGEKWNVGREAVRKAIERTELPEAFFTASDFDVKHALSRIQGPGDAFERYRWSKPPDGTTFVKVEERNEKMELAYSMWLWASRLASEVDPDNATTKDFKRVAAAVLRIYPVFLAEAVCDPNAPESVQIGAGQALCTFLTSMHGASPVHVSEAEFPMGKGPRVRQGDPGVDF